MTSSSRDFSASASSASASSSVWGFVKVMATVLSPSMGMLYVLPVAMATSAPLILTVAVQPSLGATVKVRVSPSVSFRE